MIKNKYHFTYTNYTAFRSENKKNNFKAIYPPEYFSFEKFVLESTQPINTNLIMSLKLSPDNWWVIIALMLTDISAKIHNKNIESMIRHFPPQSLFFFAITTQDKTNRTANMFFNASKAGKAISKPIKNTNLILSILKSGDFREDSGIYFSIGELTCLCWKRHASGRAKEV